MTTFLNACNSFRLWYYFTSSTSVISVSVKKTQKNSKTIIATITTGDYKTANQIWMAAVTNSLCTMSECANLSEKQVLLKSSRCYIA